MIKNTSPIIIIGNGRSGSSLLHNILGAHPEIVIFGELRFAVAATYRAMSEIFRNASAYRLLDYFNEHPGMEDEAAKSSSLMQEIVDNLEPHREQRRGDIIRQAITDALCLHERAQTYWAYKEIFNSGEAEWSIYDAVFPKAQWVHIIRNPIEYVRSVIWHLRLAATDKIIVRYLQLWTAVFRMSRQRLDTGRYYEVRYERLIANPEQTLTPFLDAIGIGWDQRCGQAVRQQVGAQSERFAMPRRLPSLIASVPELPAIMDELGYKQAAPPGRPSWRAARPPRLIQIEHGRWQLCGQIWPEEGLAWQFDLDQTPVGDKLAKVSDDVDYWTRSPLRLFEDARALGPAHALHRLIRDSGNGAYSHWQTRLIFSTSDNSDPNINGHTYSFDLLGVE
jgi:hypothetical protein